MAGQREVCVGQAHGPRTLQRRTRAAHFAAFNLAAQALTPRWKSSRLCVVSPTDKEAVAESLRPIGPRLRSTSANPVLRSLPVVVEISWISQTTHRNERTSNEPAPQSSRNLLTAHTRPGRATGGRLVPRHLACPLQFHFRRSVDRRLRPQTHVQYFTLDACTYVH